MSVERLACDDDEDDDKNGIICADLIDAGAANSGYNINENVTAHKE